MNNLLITIDTEPDCDIYWNRLYPFQFSSVMEGIPNILRPIWKKYNIKPIYFISPEVANNLDCCKILKEEIKLGAVIGAHLHSEYIEPNIKIENFSNKPSLEYPCYAYPEEIEFKKIENLTNLIEKNIGVRPIWYRAARYGADLDTIKSLKKMGYKYDSSVTPFIDWGKQGGPDHSKSQLNPYFISKNNFYLDSPKNESIGIKEYPITIFKKRLGILGKILPDKWIFYNWLRPTHMTFIEQKYMVNKILKNYNNFTFVLMFHSMEIMPLKTPYVRNKTMQLNFIRRLEKVILYINKKNEKK